MAATIPPDKICTLDGFLRQFLEQHQHRTDQPFCFILGAGASRDSNIPTGGEMAKAWLDKHYQDQNHDHLSLEDFVAQKLGIPGFDVNQPARHYSQLYELLYKDKQQAGFSYLETVMEGKDPSFGYSVLSYLLSEHHHRIVITTNFDNLVTDALAIHAGTFPIVVNEDSLVHYVRANVHRPLVAKIHGSLGFKPKSANGDLTLTEGWRKALTAIFQTHTPVVIGYDGNDGSLMTLLEEAAEDSSPEFLWWCYHCREGENAMARAAAQPERVQELILKRPAQMVPIPGFDLLMLRLLTQMEKELPKEKVPDLVERLTNRTQDRLQNYKQQRDALGAKLATSSRPATPTPVPSSPATPPAAAPPHLQDELALLAKGAETKPWWQWQNEIDALPTPDEQDQLYQRAIQSLPQSAPLLGNYAYFLTDIRPEHDKAEALYQRAIEADPKNAIHLSNYAYFLTDIRPEHDKAEALYQRAIEADPRDADYLGNYAYFLTNIRQEHDKAKALYQRAIEADPKNAIHLGNYALFLTDIRQEHDEAEALYQRTIEADPKHANHLGNYANFLGTIRQEHDKAEALYQRAIEADPKHATHLGNYATFLKNIRQEHDKAEALYRRAIEANPKHANHLGNYGQMLLGTGRVPEGIDRLQAAWQWVDRKNVGLVAELAFALFAGARLESQGGAPWEAVFKHCVEHGFRRSVWNFDAILNQLKAKVTAEEWSYAKAMAEAFLDEAKVKPLAKLERWRQLKPVAPDQVTPPPTGKSR